MASFLEAVASEIVAIIPPGLVVPHSYGKTKLEAREGLPRVIWTRSDIPSKLLPPIPSTNAKKALCTEDIPVTIHVIASDSETSENLIDIEIRALYQAFGAHILSAQVGEDSSNETLKTYGYYRQLRVNIPRPVFREAPPSIKVTSYQINPATNLEAGWITLRV